MNNDTNSMSIKTKLSLVIIIVMIGLLSISAFALYTEKSSLLNDRQVKTTISLCLVHFILLP